MMSKRWLGIVFILATLAFVLSVYGRLPEQVATHYNTAGEPDGWSSRAFAAFLLPAMALLMLLVFALLPKVSPRVQNMLDFQDTYWAIANIVVAFLCAMHVLVLGRALGWPIDITSATLLGLGVMFMALGTLMPRTRSNWWMGIRTPWTLENDDVWRETHRVGGKTFIAGGALTVVAALLPPPYRIWLAMTALVIAGFIPVIYSYIVWKGLKNQ